MRSTEIHPLDVPSLNDHSPRHPLSQAARTAGWIYLSMVFTAPFSLMYVPTTLIARENAALTASNVLAHETMFRLAIAAEMVVAVIFVLLVMALYRLLSGVDQWLARLMVGFVLMSGAITLMNLVNNVAALTLFRGSDFLAVLDKPQRDAMGMLFLRMHAQGNNINEMLWGVWLLPFGLLVMRSRFMPRILGVLLLVNGAAYVAISFITILAPQYGAVAFKAAMPALFGELAIMLWLLIRGGSIREPAAIEA